MPKRPATSSALTGRARERAKRSVSLSSGREMADSGSTKTILTVDRVRRARNRIRGSIVLLRVTGNDVEGGPSQMSTRRLSTALFAVIALALLGAGGFALA